MQNSLGYRYIYLYRYIYISVPLRGTHIFIYTPRGVQMNTSKKYLSMGDGIMFASCFKRFAIYMVITLSIEGPPTDKSNSNIF